MIIENKYSRIFWTATFVAGFFILAGIKIAFASPEIVSTTLNGLSQNTTFNPTSGESISIEIKASLPVKFTRLYLCSVSQICNGTSGNYTKYFTQTTISEIINKSWDGKNSAGIISPEGEYRISVSMLETGASESVTAFTPYSITISNQNTINTETATNTTSSSTNSEDTSTPNTATQAGYISTHSSEEGLSDYSESQTFVISAGRQRVAYVGNPISFGASHKGLGSDYTEFSWSFGDGFEMFGEKVSHTYRYPGEYFVVLNGVSGGKRAISRTSVKVLSPNISFSISTNGDIEIYNKGNTEINIGLWKLKTVFGEFVIARDTIIGAGKRIILSAEDIRIKTKNTIISLYNPSGGEVFVVDYINNTIPIVIEANPVVVSAIEPSIPKSVIVSTSMEDEIPETNLSQTASVAEAVIATSSAGFLKRAWRGSLSSIKSLARLFYDF